MIKITLVNGQKQTEALIRSLERDNAQLARAQLNTIRKNAYSKLYYAESKFEREMPKGIDYQIQRAQIKQAQIEFNQTKNAVEVVRDYIKNPENYTYKDRSNYSELRRSLQRLNLIEERNEAIKETVRQAQKEAGTVEGVTMYNLRKSQKIRALFENVLFNNTEYNFNESDFWQIVRDVKQLTGYDIEQAFMDKHFDTPSHYESGGSGSNVSLFDKLVEISNRLKDISKSLTNKLSPEEFTLLETRINQFLEMSRLGGY